MKQHQSSCYSPVLTVLKIIFTAWSVSYMLMFSMASAQQVPAPILPPSNLSPGTLNAPGETITATSITLRWIGQSPGNIVYDLGVRDLSTNRLIVDTTTTNTSFRVNNLVEGRQYRWNIRACDGSQCSSFTSPLYFQIEESRSAPPAPTNLAPGLLNPPGEMIEGDSVILRWSEVSGDNIIYDLGVRDLSTNTLIVDRTTTSRSYRVNNLVEGRQYRWNIRACEDRVCSNFTSPLYFEMIEEGSRVPPPVPILDTPGSSLAPGPFYSPKQFTWQFRWNIDNFLIDDTRYNFELFDTQSNALIYDDTSTLFTRENTIIAFQHGKSYRWRVRACNDFGCSSFSSPKYFQTTPANSFVRNISVDLNSLNLINNGDGFDSTIGIFNRSFEFEPANLRRDDKLIVNVNFSENQKLRLTDDGMGDSLSVGLEKLFTFLSHEQDIDTRNITINHKSIVLKTEPNESLFDVSNTWSCSGSLCGFPVEQNLTDSSIVFSGFSVEIEVDFINSRNPDSESTFSGIQTMLFFASQIDIIDEEPPVTDCESTADCDGDGLLDEWEHGTVMLNGEMIDLAAMGADPYRKDIFVELDYMVGDGINFRPNAASLSAVTKAFNNAPVKNPGGRPDGIALHIDAGPLSQTNEGYLANNGRGDTSKTWGAIGRGNAIPFLEYILDTCLGDEAWQALDNTKNIHFEEVRQRIFRYAISAQSLCNDNPDLAGISGIARAPNYEEGDMSGSDFLVLLGHESSNVLKFAGTFMHELGHNLGLWHGGAKEDNINRKPNYLSVMNYSFQMVGIIYDGNYGLFDYSRFKLDTLSELILLEPRGLMQQGTEPFQPTPGSERYGTVFSQNLGFPKKVDDINAPINWNGNIGINQFAINADINCPNTFFRGDNECTSGELQTLVGHNDWANLVYKGGMIGGNGMTQMPLHIHPDLLEKLDKSAPLPPNIKYAVTVSGPTVTRIERGSYGEYVYQVKNVGEVFAVYDVVVKSDRPWIDMSSIPSLIQLASGESVNFVVYINVPLSADLSAVIRPTITVTSVDNERMLDAVTLDVILIEDIIPGDLDVDGDVDRDDVNIVMALRNTLATGHDDPNDIDGDGTITVLDARRLMRLCTRPRCATN